MSGPTRRGGPTGPIRLAAALDGAGWHPAAWRHPAARLAEIFSAAYWVDLVNAAAAGDLDFASFEDSPGLQSTRLDGPDDRTDHVRGRLDAVLLAARVAPVTEGIGRSATPVAELDQPGNEPVRQRHRGPSAVRHVYRQRRRLRQHQLVPVHTVTRGELTLPVSARMPAGLDAEATAVVVAVPAAEMLFWHPPALITGLVAEHYVRRPENPRRWLIRSAFAQTQVAGETRLS